MLNMARDGMTMWSELFYSSGLVINYLLVTVFSKLGTGLYRQG